MRVPAPAPVSARPRVPAAPAFAPVASGSKSAPVPDLDDEDMLNSFLNSSLASQSSLATRGVKKAASKTVDTGKGKGKGKAKAVSPEASEDDDEEENSRGSKTRKTRASNRTTKATPRTTKTKPATAKSLPGSSDTLASVISSRWLTGPQIKDLEAQYSESARLTPACNPLSTDMSRSPRFRHDLQQGQVHVDGDRSSRERVGRVPRHS